MAKDDVKRSCYCDDCGAEFKVTYAPVMEHEFSKLYCLFCKALLNQWEAEEKILEDDDEEWKF